MKVEFEWNIAKDKLPKVSVVSDGETESEVVVAMVTDGTLKLLIFVVAGDNEWWYCDDNQSDYEAEDVLCWSHIPQPTVNVNKLIS